MKTLNYEEMMNMIATEKARLQALIDSEDAKKACNDRKTLVACLNMERLLIACGEKFTANAELYTAKREMPIFNYGTVAEQALFFLRTRKNAGKSSMDAFDHRLKGRKCEYKACLSASSKNTPYTPDDKGRYNDVLLINTQGIWYIPADEAQGLVEKYGRFSHNTDYAEYVPEDMVEACDRLTAKVFG